MTSVQETIRLQAASLLEGERDAIANAANLSALIFQTLPAINWAGFYFARGDQLVLGPFQGKPACVRIAFGRGVCGTAWAQRRTINVPDVHVFEGHIACDSASIAEIVVPVAQPNGAVIGVLDVDSPVRGRFDDDDRELLEALAALYISGSDIAFFRSAYTAETSPKAIS
jgi:GAF domain-containing protein